MNIKSIALATMLATGIATVNAQTVKGTKYVGGNIAIGVGQEKEKDSKFSNDNFDFGLNVSGGYFLSNKTALGVFLRTGISNNVSDTKNSMSTYNNKSNSNQFGGGVELVKFIPVKNKFMLALKHQLGYSMIKNDYNYTSNNTNDLYTYKSESTTNSFGYNFIPELHYFVSEKFSFNAQMGSAGISYQTTSENEFRKQVNNNLPITSSEEKSKSNEINADIRFSLRQFNLGLVYYF